MTKFSQDTIERLQTSATAVMMLVIVSAVITLVYWLSGGEFVRSHSLAIYSMVMVYAWTLVIKVAVERHQQRTNENSSTE